jgi:hypothetical protein
MDEEAGAASRTGKQPRGDVFYGLGTSLRPYNTQAVDARGSVSVSEQVDLYPHNNVDSNKQSLLSVVWPWNNDADVVPCKRC